MKRRTILTGGGIGLAASLAGCIGALGGDDEETTPEDDSGGTETPDESTPTPSPTPTPESGQEDGDAEDDSDDAEDDGKEAGDGSDGDDGGDSEGGEDDGEDDGETAEIVPPKSGDDPATVVEKYAVAMNAASSPEDVNQFVHEDAAEQELTEQDLEMIAQFEFTVESTEILEEGEDSAMVRVELTVNGPNGDPETNTTEIELRPEDGIWKLYAEGGDENGGGSTAPQVSFAFDWDGEEVTITHQGGDSITPDNTGVTSECDVPGLAIGTREEFLACWSTDISAGDTVTVSVSPGTEVGVFWESVDGSSSQMLATYTVPEN